MSANPPVPERATMDAIDWRVASIREWRRMAIVERTVGALFTVAAIAFAVTPTLQRVRMFAIPAVLAAFAFLLWLARDCDRNARHLTREVQELRGIR